MNEPIVVSGLVALFIILSVALIAVLEEDNGNGSKDQVKHGLKQTSLRRISTG